MNTGYRTASVLGAVLGFSALLIAVIALSASGGRVEGEEPGEAEAAAEAEAQVIEPLAIDVELGDLYISPAQVEIQAGTPIIASITNVGQLAHDFVIEGTETGTRLLNTDESEQVSFGPFESSARIICSVPGHAEAGMVMDIVVTDAPPGEDDEAPAPADAAAQIDANATPGPDWVVRDPAVPPADPGVTVHEITFSMTETVVEVAPGVTQEVWTFEGQVPGPVLRGQVGDIFEVTIVNDGELGHSIDFHASKVAWDDEMRTIQPGESLVYRYEAKHAGVFMYHCGTAPALHHIGNGMFGLIIVDPPNLPEVDHEFFFVQSEFYLGPEGEPGSLSKMQNDDWDAVVFNGYFNQYAHAPIRIETGERIRAFVLNAGPSENSSFHIVGTIFDTVFKEGTLLLEPDERQGGAQSLDLQPAQGGYVEFTMDEDGLYPIVTHKFSNVGRGALGLFQAGEALAPAGGGGH